MALEVVSSGFQDFEGTEEPLSYVEVKVSDKQHAGLLHVEVARGSLLSQSKVPSARTVLYLVCLLCCTYAPHTEEVGTLNFLGKVCISHVATKCKV